MENKKQNKQNVPAGTHKRHEKPRFVEWKEFVRANVAIAEDIERRLDARILRIERHRKHAAQVCLAAAACAVIALALSAFAVFAATGVAQ